jgi:hypothetical protein
MTANKPCCTMCGHPVDENEGLCDKGACPCVCYQGGLAYQRSERSVMTTNDKPQITSTKPAFKDLTSYTAKMYMRVSSLISYPKREPKKFEGTLKLCKFTTQPPPPPPKPPEKYCAACMHRFGTNELICPQSACACACEKSGAIRSLTENHTFKCSKCDHELRTNKHTCNTPGCPCPCGFTSNVVVDPSSTPVISSKYLTRGFYCIKRGKWIETDEFGKEVKVLDKTEATGSYSLKTCECGHSRFAHRRTIVRPIKDGHISTPNCCNICDCQKYLDKPDKVDKEDSSKITSSNTIWNTPRYPLSEAMRAVDRACTHCDHRVRAGFLLCDDKAKCHCACSMYPYVVWDLAPQSAHPNEVKEVKQGKEEKRLSALAVINSERKCAGCNHDIESGRYWCKASPTCKCLCASVVTPATPDPECTCNHTFNQHFDRQVNATPGFVRSCRRCPCDTYIDKALGNLP